MSKLFILKIIPLKYINIVIINSIKKWSPLFTRLVQNHCYFLYHNLINYYFFLLQLWNKILFDKDRGVRSLSVQEEEEVGRLGLKLRKYMFTMRESICFCQMCHSSDKDMSYNPKLKRWDCVDCSKELEFSELCESATSS